VVDVYLPDLKILLETYLQTYLTALASTTYPLPMPTFYDYEKNTFEKMPAGVLLPENSIPGEQEAGGEFIDTDIMLDLAVSDVKNEILPMRLFLYERAIRECIWNNRDYNDNSYKCGKADYSLEFNNGTQVQKDLFLTIAASGQYSY